MYIYLYNIPIIASCRYAYRAKSIKNKPKINEDPKDAMLREFQEEISRLKAMLESQAEGSGAFEEGGGGGGAQAGPVKQMSSKQLTAVSKELQEQKRQLQEQENMREEERERAAEEIRKKEESLARERREREMLAAQLKAMEEKVVHGSADREEAMRKEEELLKAQIELDERRAEQERALLALRDQEDAELAREEKYLSIQEEVAAKTKKLKKLWNRYEQVRAEVEDVRKENQQQKEDLLQTVRENDTQIKLINFIIDNFIPDDERAKIEEYCEWDDEAYDWVVAHQHLTGTVVRQHQMVPSPNPNPKPESRIPNPKPDKPTRNPRAALKVLCHVSSAVGTGPFMFGAPGPVYTARALKR
jgi:chromosome segregation ATPase